MAGTRYDNNAMISKITEGSDEYVRQAQTGRGNEHVNVGFPIMLRFAVLDVIFDPSYIDDTKLSHWENDLQLSNVKYAAVAPRNSIIARNVLGNGTVLSEKPMVLYPMFSHMSMPIKPGEHVWVMFENPDAKIDELGYWISRIVEPHFVDDPNFTHSNRQFDPAYNPGTIALANGTTPTFDFPNGAIQVDDTSNNRFIAAGTNSLPGDEKAYEDLIKNADGSQLVQMESVPRYKKRPGDYTLEGSNNSLIVLGTDRAGPVATYTADPNNGNIPAQPATDAVGGAAVQDFVVGRGQTAATAPVAAKNSVGKQESDKSKQKTNPNEGDVDYINDRSRIFNAQKSMVDKLFGIDGFNNAVLQTNAPTDDNGYGAIVLRTDKLRILVRSDIEFIVTGDITPDAAGNLATSTTPDYTKWAALIMKSNGEIVLKPADLAVLKLGGDDANLALLGILAPPPASGIVQAPPIVDTMGGSQGAGGAAGVFATKILAK